MIKFILFDLDNTLYSCKYGFDEKTSALVTEYISKYFGLSLEEAAEQRAKCFALYGTTLEWIMTEKGFTDIDDYYSFIHPEDEADALQPDPKLGELIEKLPCKSAILTNAPIEHAQRILKKLEIGDKFCAIFDIKWLGLKGKPREDAFRKVLNSLKAAPEEVLFIDDLPSYVKGYLAIGGKGILLDEEDRYPDYVGAKIRSLYEIPHSLNQACGMELT